MIGQHVSLPVGQVQARTRWGTHASGEVFDRKKSSYLTDDAQKFIAQQSLCAIAGLDTHNELAGLLVLAIPGFVQIVDEHTCLLRLDSRLRDSRIVQRLRQTADTGQESHLGLFFICHPTKERLCVQGTAELLHYPSDNQSTCIRETAWELLPQFVDGDEEDSFFVTSSDEDIWIHVRVRQSFFHCAKYIKTRIPGLTFPVATPIEQTRHVPPLITRSYSVLSKEVCAFLEEQVLCYLCTVDQEGKCAINHRGGAKGFLVTLPPDTDAPFGTILLPDYTGNGAFEAIGNILETGHAALIVPNYASQIACCVSGTAKVLELSELPSELAQTCVGAERVVALSVQRVEMQRGNWSPALAYECIRAERLFPEQEDNYSL